MASTKQTLSIAALALLAFVCHAATRSDAVGDRATTHAITVNSNGENTARQSDFDGDGTVGFGDFVKFAAKFGLSQGDDGYDARYDLNGDGGIGFADFVIFAENFGKEVPSDGQGRAGRALQGDGWTELDEQRELVERRAPGRMVWCDHRLQWARDPIVPLQ